MNKQVPFEKGDMDWLKRVIAVEVNEVYEWDNMLSHGRAERIIIHIKNLERENALLTGELAFVSENSGKVIEELEERIENQASSIASYHSDNVMLEAKVVRLEKLLGEIIPLIPNFNFGIEHNPPIANYDYLKYNKEWKK